MKETVCEWVRADLLHADTGGGGGCASTSRYWVQACERMEKKGRGVVADFICQTQDLVDISDELDQSE